MLHGKWIILSMAVLLTSCRQIGQMLHDPEPAPYGKYQDSLDAGRMKHYLAETIKADTSTWKADLTVKHRYDSIADFSDIPLWFSDEGLSDDAAELLDYLRDELPRHGLSPDAFYLPQIEEDLYTVQNLAFDSLGQDINQVLPRLDYHFSKAYVKYTTGIRYGFVNPAKTFNRLYMKPDSMGYAHLYDYDTLPPDYEGSLGNACGSGRMEFLHASKPANAPLYEALQGALAKAGSKEERDRLLANMERCRWQIPHPKDNSRRVVVNLPSQMLWALSPDTAFTMKVAVGAWNTKTPLLSSMISYLQVNPEWSLPPKIAASDFPRHAGDSAWFARHRYFAVNRKTGDTLNIAHISGEGFANAGLRFVQQGGQGNSLGRIVFRFSNSFSVYLHDTNSPGVFSRDRRTVSHGCVRVERPYDLALFLLPDISEWTRESLRISMDLPPETERGMKWLADHRDAPRPYRLLSYHKVSPRVPVYIIYHTVYPNPATGILETFPDVYGYDKPIMERLHSIVMH